MQYFTLSTGERVYDKLAIKQLVQAQNDKMIDQMVKDGEAKRVHISTIKVGDTVFFDGHWKTVCKSNIKKNFCGISLWGDSYISGKRKVVKRIFKTVK